MLSGIYYLKVNAEDIAAPALRDGKRAGNEAGDLNTYAHGQRLGDTGHP